MIMRLETVVSVALLLAASTAGAADYPPTPGTDRESPAYFDTAERFLRTLDLDDADLAFKRLGGTTASNWSVTMSGKRLADLKCTEGNTNHKGAVVAYRLGRALDFNIYPVAVYRDVNRQVAGRRVDEQCALKEWASVLTQYYWTRDTFANTDSRDKQNLSAALQCRQAKPTADDPFVYFARSAYGHPKPDGAGRVRYSGTASLLDAARDFSNMMVIDVLIGNEDRFPGGNLFFRSVTTSYTEEDGQFRFADARVYSLDNEASFKGRGPSSTHAARDLKNHVWRFDADMLARLRRLAEDDRQLADITDNDASLIEFIRSGIGIVLEQHAAAVAQCGEDMARF